MSAMIKSKTLIFVHQNFPGQFLHLCRELSRDNRVIFISKPTQNRVANVELVTYGSRRNATPGIHNYLVTCENEVLHGQAVARCLLQLKRRGINPDLVVGHSGWGETLFIKDVLPDVPLLTYFEFFFHAVGGDIGFDPEFPSSEEAAFRLRTRNYLLLSCLDSTDHGLAPTWWQQSRFPAPYQPKISVIHDGVDTAAIRPKTSPTVSFGEHLTFDGSVPLVTFVARNLEPYRGFHVFMRAAEKILAAHPSAHIAVVGGEGVSYGTRLPDGETYKARALREVSTDLSRLHFLGRIPYDTFKQMLQVSAAHVYLTYPFVLSWSLLEAMATECLIIGSSTPPVEEVIRDGQNGVLVDFFDPDGIASTVVEAISYPDRFQQLRQAARRTVIDRYDLYGVSLPRQKSLLQSMLA
jgi:glycosyltransferase involved in cell wall biosynthesis